MNKLQTTTFSWLLHSRKMHLLALLGIFTEWRWGGEGMEWMGVLRHVPQEMFWILTPLSPLSNSILARSILFRWDLVNRQMRTIYVSIMKNLTNFHKTVETGVDPQLVPFQAELLRIGHYTEYPRVATLNCEYFYFPLNGMPSPSQGYPKQ